MLKNSFVIGTIQYLYYSMRKSYEEILYVVVFIPHGMFWRLYIDSNV